MDDNREIRSMAIVSRLDREDNTVLDDEAVESSHSIIGSMLEWTAMANNQAANASRMNLQCALLSRFKEDLARLDPAKSHKTT